MIKYVITKNNKFLGKKAQMVDKAEQALMWTTQLGAKWFLESNKLQKGNFKIEFVFIR